jgi:hypothetical protein
VRLEDLRAYSELGRALWIEKDRSQRIALETLTAVSSLELTEPRKIERAAKALLDRAVREGRASNSQQNASALHQPFFRLSAEQRFLLVALHWSHWSYAKLARVFGIDTSAVETAAWNARTALVPALYPQAPRLDLVSCPDYEATRPWTQRFLDEEIPSAREQTFLQNHLMACANCRKALHQCRNLYYAVEAILPHEMRAQGDDGLAIFEKALFRSRDLNLPPTFRESLLLFVRRIDVQIALGLGMVLLLVKIFVR